MAWLSDLVEAKMSNGSLPHVTRAFKGAVQGETMACPPETLTGLAELNFFDGLGSAFGVTREAEFLEGQSCQESWVGGDVAFPQSSRLTRQAEQQHPLQATFLHPRRSLLQHSRMKGERGAHRDERHVHPVSHFVGKHFLARATEADKTDSRSAGIDLSGQFITFVVGKCSEF